LAATDLRFSQAYFALLKQLDDAGKRELKQEDLHFLEAVQDHCGIPPTGATPMQSDTLRSCVKGAYESQRSVWLLRLEPPLSEEANRPIERHVALQRSLQQLGFLPADAVIDGVYGSITREAISDWQRAQSREVTGVLGDADAQILEQEASQYRATVRVSTGPAFHGEQSKTTDELWVASQNIGIPLSFFSQVSPPSDANEIQIGDSLVSTLDINIRERAAKFSSASGILPKDTFVVVEDLKKVSFEGRGTQVWMRISMPPQRIKTQINPEIALRTSPPDRPTVSEDAAEPQQLGAIAKKIVDCYAMQVSGNKVTSVQHVYECSGFWVTPRALIACSLGASCPALRDTVEGRAILKTELGLANLDVNSPLLLEAKPNMLPKLPSADPLRNCKQNTTSETDFNNCVSTAVSGNYKPVFDCFRKFTEGEKLACFASQTNNQDFIALTGCLAGGRPSPDKIALCTSKPELERQVSDVRNCIE
jgi:hypothetical protein